MTSIFTLAHLSDPHLGPIVGFTPSQWRFKRLTGLINWHRKRRHAHLTATLACLLADLRTQAPDHIAVTGDLVNIGLPGEIVAAQGWLARVGPPEQVSLVPGNHDIYMRFGRDIGVERWGAYMTSTGAAAAVAERHAGGSTRFPYVRRFGRVVLIGVNSAAPMPPFVAAGRIGSEQCRRLAAILDRLGEADLVRVVLIHHPPLRAQASPWRGLRDAEACEGVLARHGAELVLHGHLHMAMQHAWPGPAGPIPIVGVPSASLGVPHPHETLARYNLYRIETGARSGARIELIERGLLRPGGPVVEIARRWLDREAVA